MNMIQGHAVNTIRASIRGWLGFSADADLRWVWATRLLLMAMLFLYVIVAFDFGISWDEPVHDRYGELVYDYYASGGSNRAVLTFGNVYLYGGLFDGIVALFQRRLSFHPIDIRHLITGLAAFLGLVGAGRLARFAGGARAAFFCILLLGLEPNYFGHAFNNPKDIPFAALHIWTLYFMVQAICAMPKISSGLVFKLGITLGMALGIRIGGSFLAGYFVLGMLGWLGHEYIRQKRIPCVQVVSDLLFSAAGVMSLAYIVMLVSWPWAQQAPLFNPFIGLIEMSRFNWVAPLILNGREFLPADMPVGYLPEYFAVKLPVFFMLSAIAGVVLSFRYLKLKAGRISLSLLCFALLFPPVYVISVRATIYDGIRHFLFLIPILAVMGGLGIALVMERLAGRFRYGWAVLFLVTGLSILPQTGTMMQLHPYEYVYYNGLVGGVKGADGRYEMDYWGHSYGEAVRWLTRYVREREARSGVNLRYKVAGFGPKHSLIYYLPAGFEYCDDVAEADFVITFKRFGADTKMPGQVVGRVSRMGVDLSVIKEAGQIELISSQE